MRPGTQLANISNMPGVDEPDDEVRRAPRRARKKSKGWLAVVFALGLAGAGVFVWTGLQRSTGAADGEAAESTLVLETFVVNLTSSEQRAYLRVGITLGLAHPLPRNRPQDIPTALVRDTILSVLATAQPEALLKIEGKRQLKEDLLKALQDRVPHMAVESVYFTEFLVQM